MFNVGDIVVCVDASERGFLQEGSTYEVHRVDDDMVSVGPIGLWYWNYRFQHLVPQVPITEADIKELI